MLCFCSALRYAIVSASRTTLDVSKECIWYMKLKAATVLLPGTFFHSHSSAAVALVQQPRREGAIMPRDGYRALSSHPSLDWRLIALSQHSLLGRPLPQPPSRVKEVCSLRSAFRLWYGNCGGAEVASSHLLLFKNS